MNARYWRSLHHWHPPLVDNDGANTPGLAMTAATFRVLRGPRAQDRIVALDSLYVNAMLMVLTFGIRSATMLYFEVAFVIFLNRFCQLSGACKIPITW